MKNSSNEEVLWARSLKVIPGGMYGHQSTRLSPESAPRFLKKAQEQESGISMDASTSITYVPWGPNLFGFNHPAIRQAADAQQDLADAMVHPSERIVELAESLVQTVTHAEWAMFCKNGSDATTISIMAARAHTGRRKILGRRALPWHSSLV